MKHKSDPRVVPTAVKAPHGARALQITWADGRVSTLAHELLRGYCPCAHCQGHGGGIQFVPGGNLELRDLEQVGNYALRFTWGDQHDTGLYTFHYLRALDGATRERGPGSSSPCLPEPGVAEPGLPGEQPGGAVGGSPGEGGS
jgi:DUF971 family protein